VILLDANILVVDLGFPGDVNFTKNRLFLDTIASQKLRRGILTQGLLEVVGRRSHNTSQGTVAKLPMVLARKYGLEIVPDPSNVPEYAGCRYDEILTQMVMKMSLGDAVMAVQIGKFAPTATVTVTWDAAHFVGKVAIPVLTPAEWLARNP